MANIPLQEKFNRAISKRVRQKFPQCCWLPNRLVPAPSSPHPSHLTGIFRLLTGGCRQQRRQGGSARGEEAINTQFCSSTEKFHTVVLRGLRNISEAP